MHCTRDSDNTDEVLPMPSGSLRCLELCIPPQLTDESLAETVAAYQHTDNSNETISFIVYNNLIMLISKFIKG